MTEKSIGTTQDIIKSTGQNFIVGGSYPDTNTATTLDKEKEVVDMVIKKYDIGINFAATLHTRFDDLYEVYMGYAKPSSRKWYSNIFVPTGFTVIETLLPQVMAALFGKKPMIRISPRTKEDVKLTRLLNILTKYQLTRMKAFNKFYLWIKCALMYGVGVIKLYWEYEAVDQILVVPKYIDIPFTGKKIKVGRKTVKKKVVKSDDPNCDVSDIYDFFLPPRATNIDDAEWAMQRMWVHKDKVINNPRYNDNKFKLNDSSSNDKIDMTKDVRVKVGGKGDPSSMLDDDMVMLIEYWEDNRLITIANKELLLRDLKSNPFNHGHKPFYLLKDVEMPHEYCGRGELEPIKPLILERNAIRSQRLDNVKNIVNRKLIVNRNADIDLDTIDEDNKPGGIILTDDVMALRYLDEVDIVASSYQEDAVIMRDIQEATAMNETVVGMLPSRGETATTINAMQSSAASRFALKIRAFVNSGIRDFIIDMVSLNNQFIDRPRVVRITSRSANEFAELSGEEITMNYDYDADISIFEYDQVAEKQQWLELISNPIIMGAANVNIDEIQRETFVKFGVEDPDRFITEYTDEMRNAAAQNNAQSNVAAGGTPAKTGAPSSVPGVPVSPAARG